MMGAFDFDTVPCRRGTGSYKWDSAADADVLPLWVADMDFPTAPAVREALARRVEHGVFGYTSVPDAYYDALIEWMRRRHGLTIGCSDVIYTSGVVPAISAIIKALTRPGDGVIVQTPVYNCFFSSIRNNGCRQIDAPLIRRDFADGTFTYEMDFDGLERAASDPRNRLMLLCNPHNPAGRAWTRDELAAVYGICRRHGVTVVSDEIHCELTMPGISYTPMASLSEDAYRDTVTCLSPSKAFNTAGLQIANIVTGDARRRYMIDRAINDNEVCDVNPFGVVALIAAYNEGAPWLDSLRGYLHGNYMFLRDFFAERLPQLPVCRLEATYLAWVDISPLGVDSDTLENLLIERARVWVNAGAMYGADGYIRINMATSRAVLADGLERLARGVETLLRNRQ